MSTAPSSRSAVMKIIRRKIFFGQGVGERERERERAMRAIRD